MLNNMISVIFPAYNEEENVERLHKAVNDVLKEMNQSYEIIAVENGSRDRTLERLKTLTPVKIVVIAKNIGQTAGLDAGFKVAKGDVIITMDGDLQNDPQDIPRLVEKLNEGYDVVSGWRKMRRDSFNRRILSRLANWLTWKITGLYLHDSACALKAYRKKILEGINLYGEMHVFLPAYLYQRGAKVVEMEVGHYERKFGRSKHNFMKAVKDISDLLTIKFISSSLRPLLLFGGLAILLWFLALLSGSAAVALRLFSKEGGLMFISFVFLSASGLILLGMGFLAELLMRIYYESKNSTPYIIKEIIERF